MNAFALAARMVATLLLVALAVPLWWYVYQAAYGDDPTRPKLKVRDHLAAGIFVVPAIFITLVAVWL